MHVQAEAPGQAAQRLDCVVGRQAELRAVVRGLDRLVGVGLDARRDAHEAALGPDRTCALELVERVEHDQGAGLGRAAQQLVLLVVAVDHESFSGDAGAPRELELAHRRDVRTEALVGEQLQHRDRREGLRPVDDERAGCRRGVRPRLRVQRHLVVDRRPASRTRGRAPTRARRRARARRRRRRRRPGAVRARGCRSVAAREVHRYTAGSERASYLSQGVTRRPPRQPPPASRSRGFFVSRGRDGRVRRPCNRAEVAVGLGGRAVLPRRRPRAARAARASLLHARDAAVPVRQPAHGARPQLHAGRRRHALQATQRLHRAAADGLRLVRPARRERRDQGRRSPARDHRAQHRGDPCTRCAAWAGRSTGSARCPRTSRPSTAGRSGCS